MSKHLSVEDRLAIVRAVSDIFGPERAEYVWKAMDLPPLDPPAICDELADFFTQATEPAPTKSVTADALYRHYWTWASHQSEPPLSRAAFGRRLGAIGIERKKSNRVRYVGLVCKPFEAFEMEPPLAH